jgi:hypothetical protein
MINFNNFKSTTANNSNFVDTVSLEEMKSAANGAAINVVQSKEKTHASGATMCFFACGEIRGMVAEKLSNKMLNNEAYDTPVVSEVVMQDGNHMLIMHEQGNNSNAIVSF